MQGLHIVPSETNCHTLDCRHQAADHIRQAITLLLASNDDSTDCMIFISELKQMVGRAERGGKL